MNRQNIIRASYFSPDNKPQIHADPVREGFSPDIDSTTSPLKLAPTSRVLWEAHFESFFEGRDILPVPSTSSG